MQAEAPPERAARLFTTLVLATAVLVALLGIFHFGQTRFFTIDEYQYGHATWLVAGGALPYVDFFEHHFPLSYVLHAPFVSADAATPHTALLLRGIVFAYILGASIGIGAASLRVTQSPHAALLCVLVANTIGFSLMSVIDYRADGFGALLGIASLCLLETNRCAERRGLAIAAGLLAAMSVLMTQKMIFLLGGTIGVLLLADRLAALRRDGRPPGTPCLRFPLAFLGAAAGLGVLALLVGAWLGILPSLIQHTLVEAVAHEQLYEPFSAKRYLGRYLRQTWPSTLLIGGFALYAMRSARTRFWGAAVAVGFAGAFLVRAPYPYNFVFLCYAIGIAAARGYAELVEKLRAHPRVPATLALLLYLAPIAVVLDQAAFVRGRTSNERQLALLTKIMEHTSPDDAVIDNAGGAMFNRHASWYYYLGRAHIKMFADYFENELVADYRRSQAPFWLRDIRTQLLPASAKRYLNRVYIRADGPLMTLGIITPETGEAAETLELEIVREGPYYVHPLDAGDAPGAAAFEIDGRPLAGDRIRLTPGSYRLRVPPQTPAHRITIMPGDFFQDPIFPQPRADSYSKLFEY